MVKKNFRQQKIKECMRKLDRIVTITEIYEWIFKTCHIDVTRKTIQRDMDELIERKEVLQREGCPLRFSLIETKTYQIELTLVEVDEVLASLTNKPAIQEKILSQVNEEESFG